MSKRDRFTIPQIEEEKKKEHTPSKFVSPYSGSNAKDEHVYPYVKYGNDGKQFQSLKDKSSNDDLDMIYTDREAIIEAKKKKEEDKYSPSRIPSYYRKEENLGINRSNLADLRGDKLSEEEILERNRKSYSINYQEIMSDTPKPNNNINNERVQNNTINNSRNDSLVDPLNMNSNNSYNNYANISYNNNNYNNNNYNNNNYNNNNYNNNNYNNNNYNEVVDFQSSTEEVSSDLETNDYEVKKEKEVVNINSNANFFHIDDEEKVVPQPKRSNLVVDDFGDVNNSVDDIVSGMPRSPRNSRTVENVNQKGLFFGNKKAKFYIPPLEILKRNGVITAPNSNDVNYQISVINRTLEEFKVGGKVIHYTKGPTVTQFEIKLDPGVNVNKVTALQKNLQMNLASESIRIEAPIPGKSTIGIEAPNVVKDMVLFGDLVSNEKYLKDGKPLNVILGLSISGDPVYTNIAEMPHCLVAGATGGGKTVCIYSLILSMIYKVSPEEVKMILIDPKGNELMFFEDIPHLATPIINDAKLATASLKWAVDEMERRYDFLKANRKRTIADYNAYAVSNGLKIIPYLVIVIDEFADLMNTASETFETNVQRLTQKARSAGIHIIIATQRPSTDVIKGTIKANISTRIAFAVQTQTDSFTILDHVGAEKLLGKGDMLYTKGNNDVRIQGCYISDTELDAISTFYYEKNSTPNYMFTHDDLKKQAESDCSTSAQSDPMDDELFEDIARFVFRQRKASANQIQNTYEVGFNRANKIINGLAQLGIVTSENIPGKAREVVIKDIDELEDILKNR